VAVSKVNIMKAASYYSGKKEFQGEKNAPTPFLINNLKIN